MFVVKSLNSIVAFRKINKINKLRNKYKSSSKNVFLRSCNDINVYFAFFISQDITI